MPGTNWKIDLQWIAQVIGMTPRTVCECGVGPLDISIAPSFVGKCSRLLLVEPHPEQFKKVCDFFESKEATQKVTFVEAAIGFEEGEAELILNNGSSYLDSTWSPTPVKEPTKIKTLKIRFDEIDDGNIDVMNLDCEGMEWAVLKNMKSRPELLVIEIWEANPYKAEIMRWLEENHYTLRFSTGPTSETHLFECTL